MKAIWSRPEASFEGELVRFAGVRPRPKPVQEPHPPILLGAGGPRALERVVGLADEWFPFAGPQTERRIGELCSLAGGGFPVSIFDPRATAPSIERYRELGADRLVFALGLVAAGEAEPRPPELADQVLR
jgi:Luciferase-like monooxygenase